MLKAPATDGESSREPADLSDFIDYRISASASYGSSYTEKFAVQKIITATGAEYSQLLHPLPMRRFTLVCREPLSALWSEILDLYAVAYGTHAGFRLQAIDDYTTAADGRSAPTMLDQTLTYISAGVYQLIKEYGKAKPALAVGRPKRILYKPVTGSVVVAVNGTLKSSGVAIDYTTGIVTLSSPTPAFGDAVTAGCQFDHPVRFDTDLEVGQAMPMVRMIERLELIELLKP